MERYCSVLVSMKVAAALRDGSSNARRLGMARYGAAWYLVLPVVEWAVVSIDEMSQS